MLIFRKARKSEAVEITDVLTEAFEDYPMFKQFEPDDRKRYAFTRAIQELGVKTNMRRGQIYVAEDEGRIAAVSSIHFHDIKQAGVYEYIRSGAPAAMFKCGFKKVLAWFGMYGECVKPCKGQEEPLYYIEDLAVKKSYQGKGVGSRMLSECIIPLVKRRGGGTIVFVTNTKSNAGFYTNRGFECFHKGRYKRGNINFYNYGFRMKV